MNRYTYLALAAVPAICLSACSESSQPTTVSAIDPNVFIAELATTLETNKNADLPTYINALHKLMQKNTPGVIKSLAAMTDEQKITLIQQIPSSESASKIIATAITMQNSKVAETISLIVADKNTAKVNISLESKLQFVDISADIIKIAIALGVDKPQIQEALGL